MLAQSITKSTKSGLPSFKISTASASSGETGFKDAIPGRSKSVISLVLKETSALPTSTVVAGQLPILRCTPEIRVKRVDFPTLDRPTSATTGFLRSSRTVPWATFLHSEHTRSPRELQ